MCYDCSQVLTNIIQSVEGSKKKRFKRKKRFSFANDYTKLKRRRLVNIGNFYCKIHVDSTRGDTAFSSRNDENDSKDCFKVKARFPAVA